MRVSVQQKIIEREGYRVIIIGILLFQCIVISVDADPSQGRWGHTSILINNRLYIYGGETDTSNILSELIYLDVSEPFGTESPPWVELPPSADGISPSPLAFHSCSFGGSQKELLILFGGESSDQVNSLFIYNTTGETWSVPSTTDIISPKRGNHTMVTRESDSIAYLWGGTPIGDGEEVTALNDLYQLNTDTLSWNPLSSGPAGRWDHSATLLNDGKMYIIGGMVAAGSLASMSEIPIYDTNVGIWTTSTAMGSTITSRRSHRAVGTTDNRIIIYGGTTAEFGEKFNDIAVLNVNVTDSGVLLTWTQPTVLGSTPPGRYAHSMTLVGSKAIIAFGSVDEEAGRKLFVFNVDSYEWEPTYNTTTTTPTAPPGPTSTSIPSGNKVNSNLGIIVGIPVAGVVIVLVLVGLLFFWFRKRKNKSSFSAIPYEKQQPSIPPISGPAPAPLHNLNNYGSSSPSQDSVDGTPFIPPFATSSYQRRQPSSGSINETRNLTPVDQHDSWGSAPSNSSQSQLPQINPSVPSYETNNRHSPTISKTASPISNYPYLPSPTFLSQHRSNTPPTPPPSTPTPPPVSPQKDLFPISTAAGASSSTKTSSTNLRLDSDSNTAPIELDYNPPPVAPLFINRTRTPSPSQAQTQQLTTPSRLPISTSSSSSSLPKDSTNVLASSPTEMEAIETTTTSTENEGGTFGLFNSPLFRTEALSAYAGTAAAASPADRTRSLRSVPRSPRGSTGLPSPSSISAGGRLRSGTLDGQHTYTYDGNTTGGSRPTSPTDTSDNQPPRTRLFGANTDPSDDGY